METNTPTIVKSYVRNAVKEEAVTKEASNLPVVIMLCATVLISSFVYPAIFITLFTATAFGYALTKLKFKSQPTEVVEAETKAKRGYHRRLVVNSYQSKKPVILKYN